ACWYDVDQTRDSHPREIGPAGAIGAYERKSASKGLTLYDGKAFLTGREHKNVGRSIEILKLPLGNRVVMNESWVIWKRGVKQSSHMDQSNPLHCLDCFSKDIRTLPIRPGTGEQESRLGRQSACAQGKLIEVYAIRTQK